MTKKQILTFGTLHALLIAVIALCAVAYLREKQDATKLEASLAAQNIILKDRAQQIKDAGARIEQRDEQTSTLEKALAELKAKPATIQEIVKEIPQYVPLESPPQLVQLLPEASPVGAGPLASGGREQGTGNREQAIQFTSQQAKDLRTFYLNCSGANRELSACELDLKDFGLKEKAYRQQISAMTGERDQAVKAVKGGSFFARLKREAKDVAMGLAVGAALGYAAHR
jgi:hypothetical protein